MSLEITDDTYEAVIAGASRPLLILFMASFCGPTHMQFSLLDHSLEGEDRYIYAEVDVEKCPKMAQAYKVRGLPMMVFTHRGEQLGARVGTMDERYFNEFIDGMMAKVAVDTP